MLTAVRAPRLALTQARVTKGVFVAEVHDGDTITVDINTGVYTRLRDQDLGFHIYIKDHYVHIHNSVRFYGLNAPELITPEGKVAQAALAAFMPVGSAVDITTWMNRADKYGRILANITFGTIDVNQWLIDGGYAAPWDGHGTKPVPT